MKKVSWVAACGVVLFASVLVARATEGGGGAYPNGAEGLMTGALPPPGNYLIDYAFYYSASDFMDGQGHRVPMDFDLEVYGNVFRFVHVTGQQILGASWAQHIFIPVVNVDVTTPGGSDDKLGLGDIIVDPIILGWHKGNLHCAAGVDVYVPVGSYDDADIANVGRNYWTIEPVFACTLLCPQGYEASVKLMYDFNTENEDTDYESGDEFHADYALAKRFKDLTVGAGGFYYQQITDDEGPTAPPDGNKGKQLGVGPEVSYQYKGMSLSLKYLFDMETENRPEGEHVWLRFVTAL